MSFQEAKERLAKQRETAFYDQLAQASAILEEAVHKAREAYEAATAAIADVSLKIEEAAQGRVDQEIAQKLSSEAYQLRYQSSQLIVSGTVSASRIAASAITTGAISAGMGSTGRL